MNAYDIALEEAKRGPKLRHAVTSVLGGDGWTLRVTDTGVRIRTEADLDAATEAALRVAVTSYDHAAPEPDETPPAILALRDDWQGANPAKQRRLLRSALLTIAGVEP